MPIRRIVVVLLVVLFVHGVAPAAARDILQGDLCEVSAGETVVGDLFVLCRTLDIDGTVEGNIIGAATTANLNGDVEGSIYLIAGQFNVGGTVGGSIHFAGPALRLTSAAAMTNEDADILSASLSTQIEPEARVPNAITGVGYQLVVNGIVDGEVNFWGSALTINGTIERDVYATVGSSESSGVAELQTLLTFLPVDVQLERPGLRVGSNATIAGLLDYTAPAPGVIDAELAQPPRFTQVFNQPDLSQIATITQTEDLGRDLGLYFGQVVREFVTLFIVGSLMVLLVPGLLALSLRNISSRPLPSLGLGLLTFVISFPVLAILIVFSTLFIFALGLFQLGDLTLAGAVLLGVANLSLGTIFYFIAIFASRAMVCYGLGRLLIYGFRPTASLRLNPYLALALGSAVLAFAFSLPAVGWLISAVAAFLGLGALLVRFPGMSDLVRRPYARSDGQRALPERSEDARQYPPPMLDGGLKAPGMENLPAGFRWWDED